MAYEFMLIAILIVIALVVIFKSQDVIFIFALIKKYLFVVFFLVLVIFAVFAIASVNKNYDTDYTNFKGILTSSKFYLIWFKDAFVKIGKVTGYAVNQDWFNSTESNSNPDRENRRTR